MADVRPDEITAILRRQLSGYEKEIDIYDVGTVLQVGDGIAARLRTLQGDGERTG